MTIISILKKLISFIFIGLFIVLILAGYFFVWPRLQEFNEKKREIETRDEEISQHEQYLTKLNITIEDLLNYTNEISKINAALPSDASIAALFNFLQKASSQNGLIMSDIDVSQLFSEDVVVSDEGIRKMPFSIKVTGSYTSLKSFINTIFITSRLIKINSINFSAPGEESGNLFDFSLELETQSFPQRGIIDESLLD